VDVFSAGASWRVGVAVFSERASRSGNHTLRILDKNLKFNIRNLDSYLDVNGKLALRSR